MGVESNEQKKIWVLNKKKDGVESNEQKQKMGFEQKKRWVLNKR